MDRGAVLLPFEPAEVGAPPELDYLVWEGDGHAPPGARELARVAFYVPPYMPGTQAVDLIAAMPGLRVVQTVTAGVDAVAPAVPPGVLLCNARGVHDASTAELAMALVLASLRGLPGFVRSQDRQEWAPATQPSLADRTVLVVGHGSIGEALERRLAGFEVELLRVARRARPGVSGFEELPRLLPRADVVVLLVPMTRQTRRLVDADFLAALPDGALVVNMARGPVVDTDALLAELRSGRLRAALDVTDPEPLPAGHQLWTAPNLLLSPHVGGDSTAFRPRVLRLLREQLHRWATGQELAHVVVGDY